MEKDGVVMIVSHEGSKDEGGENSRENRALEKERKRGDVKGRKAGLAGGGAATENDDFGMVLEKDAEYTKSQIEAGGCGIVGCDCPEGFEHAPFRCGAEVICGVCGAVMPRGRLRFCSRDAPRFWSKLGMACVEVSPLMVLQRQAAWQVYAEMQRREMQPRSSCDRGDGNCAHRRQSEHVSRGDSGIGDGAAAGAQVGPPRGSSSGGAANRAESGLGTDSMC